MGSDKGCCDTAPNFCLKAKCFNDEDLGPRNDQAKEFSRMIERTWETEIQHDSDFRSRIVQDPLAEDLILTFVRARQGAGWHEASRLRHGNAPSVRISTGRLSFYLAIENIDEMYEPLTSFWSIADIASSIPKPIEVST